MTFPANRRIFWGLSASKMHLQSQDKFLATHMGSVSNQIAAKGSASKKRLKTLPQRDGQAELMLYSRTS